ncbi:MAG: diphthine--ammonia ligase [Candidatus Nanohaloarchaea archaeon]
MCGIAGGAELEVLLDRLEHRGSSRSRTERDIPLGHVLHPVVGEVEQPLEGEGVIVANCEIYNWKALDERHGYGAENDAELLLKLLDERGLQGLEEVEGVYAFAYLRDGELVLARDELGVKPLWYSEKEFAFASEKQALEAACLEARELHPRRLIRYDLEERSISFEQRDLFEVEEEERSLEAAAEEVKERFVDAVEKRVPDCGFGLLFSGGVDSTMIAAALQELGEDFTCYTSGIQYGNTDPPRDVEWAREVADKMGLDLEVHEATLEEVEAAIPEIADWISSTSTVKIGVALPFHLALQESEEGEKVVFSGLGSEQLYAGYSRHQGYLNRECLSGLRSLFHRDLYRDDVVAMRNGYELRVPFLDTSLVEHALTIPGDQKVRDGHRKYVLRKVAEKLGVPEEVAWRKKTAAQYGSNFDKAISRLARDRGFDHKQTYLNSLRAEPNKRLAALTSGGKDSNAAIYRMMRRNNEMSVLVNLQSENQDSYMFDSKEKNIVEEQAEILDVPLLVQETAGEKEEELEDLESAFRRARDDYGIEGVVTGALASTYQRDRVEKVAEATGLKVFAPLWQEDQERYIRWLVREGFNIEITKVAARGLDESWEGRELDGEAVEDLIELSQEYGFNAAGEGGEFETVVTGFPSSMLPAD